VIHALALLGVVDVVPAPDFVKSRDRDASPAADEGDVAFLDEEAIRARVRARVELVDEGDYFAVLGVSRDATTYEIRRAFIELRRNFEPSRILTPRVADLADEVRKIVTVLEEAYEILRDNARRERYRRAIEARPE
jgi:preprotein translocase subunit Sec63